MPTTQYTEILAKIQKINPINYAKTRNNLDGAVTQLSPFISRGVISTKQVMEVLIAKGYRVAQLERILQQLAWRDYFQRVAQTHSELWQTEITKAQEFVVDEMIPTVVLDANTGISAVDMSLNNLYQYGTMHNHMRMYVASIVCNLGQSSWRNGGKWMYYHLLDADIASNFCSWQWICGAFSSKLYFANQENINKYSGSEDVGTFLDSDYRKFNDMLIPQELTEKSAVELVTFLPEKTPVTFDKKLPTIIYNHYNLDPVWRQDEEANRVLLIEPSHFNRFPIIKSNMEFFIELSKNIPNIQVFVGEFDELKKECPSKEFISKEHPLFSHIPGTKDERDWMFPEVDKMQPSFFKYWEKIQKTQTYKKIKLK